MTQVRAWAIASIMLATTPSTNAALSEFQQAASPQLKQAAQHAQQAANTLQAQARDAWKKVDSAKAVAHAIDAQANQAVSSADRAHKNMLTLGAGILASAEPLSSTTYSATAQATTLTPAVLNNIGQQIGARLNIAA
ncbi:MAG: hypothetical protein K2X65_04620 [Burkholderiaceae bacterium]|jgi:hypothetical protein|nr:hypothetical protein [Burkholderiaceae bacterium]